MVLLLLHAGVTLVLFGVILVVQVVHYPLFRHVGPDSYAVYQAEHMWRITWIVGPLMTIELLTAGLLLWHRPSGVSLVQAGSGLALVLVIWIVTALVQVPLHRTLLQRWSRDAHERLVRSNWLRTGAWTVRVGLVGWMLATSLAT